MNIVIFLQVNCRGYNAFGRRRRDVDAELNDTALSVSEGYDGQLREEITISSNLIRTYERTEERYSSDPGTGNFCLLIQNIKKISTISNSNNVFLLFNPSSSISSTSRGYLCIYCQSDNSIGDICVTRTGSRRSCCILLAHGLSSSTRGQCRATATSARIS